ncbi:MAG: molecular chaperone HtpG [Deinococcales bacterium]
MNRGTSILIKLKEEHKEFAQSYRLNSIIREHSNFLDYPIYVAETDTGGEGDELEWKQANERLALWRKSSKDVTEEQYKSFYQNLSFDYSGEPMMRLHLQTDVPLQLYSLLFVPSKRDWRLFRSDEDYGLKLYVRKVLIIDKFKDILPPYLRFVQGVVDSEDLPLNVSRQMVQDSPLVKKISEVLIGRISNELKRMAKNEPEKYKTFWKEFGIFIKEGVASDFRNKDKWVELLRFCSSHSPTPDDTFSIQDYLGRMKEGQEAIYYVMGDNFNSLKHSPHLDYFRKHNIEVLLFTEPVDSYMLLNIGEVEGKSFKNIDDADLELPKGDEASEEKAEDSKLADDAFISLKSRVKQVLGDKIADVRESKVLSDSACRLVNPSGGMDATMQRLQRMMGEQFQENKRILELNSKSPFIKELSNRLETSVNDPLINPLIEQLFESALVAEGIHPNPSEMLPRIQKLMEAALGMKS